MVYYRESADITMSNNKKPVGTSATSVENELPDPKSWPTKAEAARAVGVTPLTIKRWQQKGELHSIFDSATNTWRYNPEELQVLGNSVDTMDPAQLISSAKDLVEQAHDHVEKLINPAHKYLELMEAENEHLRKRCEQLENQIFKMFEVHEAALSLQSQREMERWSAEQREARKQWVLKKLGENIPLLVSGFAAKNSSTRGAMLEDIVAGLDNDTFETIALSGIVPAEKVGILRTIREQILAEKKTNNENPENVDGSVPSLPS